MDFRPMDVKERTRLMEALRGNADGEVALEMNPRDTTFVGVADDVDAAEGATLVNRIKSVPVHY